MKNELSFEQGVRQRWQFAKIDPQQVKRLAEQHDLDPLLARLLVIRKFGDEAAERDILEFISPSEKLITDISYISSPDQVAKATLRVQRAIENKEGIVVNGDPDADGITGTTVIVSALRELGANVSYDFPTRSIEGHGLQPRIIDDAKTNGVKLIITVDCGTKDNQATEYANSEGIDVIICDHHTIGKNLPQAYAILNPFLVKEKTMPQSLAGAGMALKFMIACFEQMNRPLPQDLLDYMVAVATLGTISDRMSLLNPMNRIIVKKGVEVISRTRMSGLRALRDMTTQDLPMLRPRDMARTIIPRLNAPGRIGNRHEGIPDSNSAVELLLLGTGRKNEELAQEMLDKMGAAMDNFNAASLREASLIEDTNERRKYITSKIEDEIDVLIEAQVNPEKDRVIIVQGRNWNPGVIGIDTDRLKERFLRPAMILTEYDDSLYVRGSIRSIPTINMYRVIDEVGDIFEEKQGRKLFVTEVNSVHGKRIVNAFGGHAQACGFTLHKSDIPMFIELVREVSSRIPNHLFQYFYEILDHITLAEINDGLIRKLDTLIPYGQNFEFPTFYIKRCLISRARAFGNKYQEARTPHVDFLVRSFDEVHQGQQAQVVQAVGFGLWEKLSKLKAQEGPNLVCDIIAVVEQVKNRHRKKERNAPLHTIRLNVVDIRPSR